MTIRDVPKGFEYKPKRVYQVEHVNADEFNFVERRCLYTDPELEKEAMLLYVEVRFPGGYFMSIQAMSSSDPEMESCTVFGVLYHCDGSRKNPAVRLGQCSKQCLSGPFEVEHDGVVYAAELIPSKDTKKKGAK